MNASLLIFSHSLFYFLLLSGTGAADIQIREDDYALPPLLHRADTMPILSFTEVEHPEGPYYYEPVRYQGQLFTGTLIDLREDGRLSAWKQIEKGRAHGLWQEWHPNGALRYQGRWKEGYQEGEQIYYYANGLQREVSRLERGKLNGSQATYAPDGRLLKLCGYIGDSLSGSCMIYGPDPQPDQAAWDTIYSGALVKEFWPDGRPKLWSQRDSKGRAHGLWLEWTADGFLRYRAQWVDDLGEGSWTYFHDSGRLRSFAVYRADTLLGEEWQWPDRE